MRVLGTDRCDDRGWATPIGGVCKVPPPPGPPCPQVYLKLVAGEYLPVQNDVNLREFGDQLVAGPGGAPTLAAHFLPGI